MFLFFLSPCREVMGVLIREFQSPDDEMKKIVLKVRFNPMHNNLEGKGRGRMGVKKRRRKVEEGREGGGFSFFICGESCDVPFQIV